MNLDPCKSSKPPEFRRRLGRRVHDQFIITSIITTINVINYYYYYLYYYYYYYYYHYHYYYYYVYHDYCYSRNSSRSEYVATPVYDPVVRGAYTYAYVPTQSPHPVCVCIWNICMSTCAAKRGPSTNISEPTRRSERASVGAASRTASSRHVDAINSSINNTTTNDDANDANNSTDSTSRNSRSALFVEERRRRAPQSVLPSARRPPDAPRDDKVSVKVNLRNTATC